MKKGLLTPHQALQLLRMNKTAAVAGVLSDEGPKRFTAIDALKKLRESPKPAEFVDEASRIKGLQTWDPTAFNTDLTKEFKLPKGEWVLNPLQNAALYWAMKQKGLLGVLPVGAGKTLVSVLAPLALGARRPLLLIPPTMLTPFHKEKEKIAKHFKVPSTLYVVPYSQLSVASSTKLLEDDIKPDLIIADEVHNLRNPDAARTRRFLRYIRQYPHTMLIGLSGTMTSRGLRDYAHISEAALKSGSPIPMKALELLAWSACLDADGDPRDSDWSIFRRFDEDIEDADLETMREQARASFQKRLISTPGVVTGSEQSVKSSLILNRIELSVPEAVHEALDNLRKTWCRPDGEELQSALDFARCALQLSQGFFLYWDWKDGVVDWEWMNARSKWHRVVREVLQENQSGIDSPLLVFRATESGVISDPYAREALEGWKKVRDRPQPPTAVTWLDTYVVEAAMEWMKKHPNGLVWQRDSAIEQMFRSLGVPVYGAGETPDDDGVGKVVSIQSHGTGLNLQTKHSKNLIISFPSSGKTVEQLIGRTHRQGQTEDEVTVDYFAPTQETKDCVNKAIRDATYIQQTTQVPQKLIYGTWLQETR